MNNLATITFVFLAGAGIAMTSILWWWQRNLNGNRRVSSWIVTLQATGWLMLLMRTSWSYVFQSDLRPPPSGWILMSVFLMNLGQAGHLYTILKRKHTGKEGRT